MEWCWRKPPTVKGWSWPASPPASPTGVAGRGVRLGADGGRVVPGGCGGRGSGARGAITECTGYLYSESSCGNWFALSTCHICTPCSKYWPLLSIERILIYYIVTWTVEPARAEPVVKRARMVRWPAWAVSLFVCKQLSTSKILISGWAFKLKVCPPLTTDQYSVSKIIKEAKSI